MISVLLLSLALAGGPAESRAAAPVPPGPDDPAVRIWLSDDGRYLRGDQVKVEVRTRNDGYLLVLHVDPDGRLRVLFPLDPTDDNFVRGGRRFEIVGRGDRRAFTTDAGTGHGTVYAAVSRDPFRFEGFVAGDHWDFRALNDVRISRDVEADLNDFVRRLAVSDFDYDIVGYDVYRDLAELRGYERYAGTTYVTYAWPGWYSPWWYRPWWYSAWYDPWCWGWPCRPFFGGTSVFIGISFGRPQRFFFGNPFFFDPFFVDAFVFDPFFVDPFFVHRPFVAGAFVFPLRPFRPRSPFFWPPAAGGHFATPWRPRWDGATYAGSGTWRGRTFPGVQYVPGQLASAQGRRPGPGVQPVSGVRERSFDMTPGRVEARRPPVTVGRDPDRSPAARRPPERREPDAAPLARPITEPRPLPEAHAAEPRPTLPRDVSPGRADDSPRRVDDSPRRADDSPVRAGGDDPGERGMRRSFDLPRRVEPREPEAHRVEPRDPEGLPAAEARPAPRAPEVRPMAPGRFGGEARPQVERGRVEPSRAEVTREAAEWRSGDGPRGGGFRGRAFGGGRHGGAGGGWGSWGGGRGGGRH